MIKNEDLQELQSEQQPSVSVDELIIVRLCIIMQQNVLPVDIV